jgi:hypothetical protein
MLATELLYWFWLFILVIVKPAFAVALMGLRAVWPDYFENYLEFSCACGRAAPTNQSQCKGQPVICRGGLFWYSISRMHKFVAC